LLSTTRFDALILNLLTPEADSFDLLQHVKTEPRWRGIPILVLTGQEISSHALRILRQEREFWTAKPGFWKDDLLRQLQHSVKSD
jgi:CheY-like chemotaxis protein